MRSRYTRWFAGALACFLSGIALFNWAVDPLDVYRSPWSQQLAAFKTRSMERVAKAEIARSVPLDAVILGDSRVLRGFDPRHPALSAYGRSYNLGVSAGSIYEATRMLELCRRNHPPKLVVWNLAPELVESGRSDQTSYDYTLSRLNPRLNPVLYHSHNLWGRDVLRASIDVLKRRCRDQSAQIVDGFAPDTHWEDNPLELFRNWLPVAAESPVDKSALSEHFDVTRSRIAHAFRESQQQGTRIIVLFPPIHAAYLEGMSQLGEWEAYEQGKRLIVALAEQCNQDAPEQPAITVWDFSAFRGLPAEPPPEPGSQTQMTWYLDPLHFRETLGTLVLDRIFDRDAAYADFGVVLTSKTIEPHLTALRADREAYRRASQEVLRLVSEQAGARR